MPDYITRFYNQLISAYGIDAMANALRVSTENLETHVIDGLSFTMEELQILCRELHCRAIFSENGEIVLDVLGWEG